MTKGNLVWKTRGEEGEDFIKKVWVGLEIRVLCWKDEGIWAWVRRRKDG
nr:hypothetical protein [Bacillus altitudinis]